MSEENNVNFSTIEKIDIDELEELIEDFPEEELCDCDCGIHVGFDGNYSDLLAILYAAEENYIQTKSEYEEREVTLWFDTDWDEVFPERKPTQKEKEMHIKNCLSPLKLLRDLRKARYDNFKRMYELSLKYTIEVLR